MECDKHENMVVLHAFSDGECENCGKEITTSHIPCDKICETCSEKYKLCVICGEEISVDVKYKKLLEETAIEMGKGSKWNPETESCEFERGSWCDLPKYKHCKHCMRLPNGDKACEIKL
jgi:hypothetical protein